MCLCLCVCRYRRRSGSRQSGVCLPSRASRSAVRSNAIRWSRCSSFIVQTTNSKTWDMSHRAIHSNTGVRHRGPRHTEAAHTLHRPQTGCLTLSVMHATNPTQTKRQNVDIDIYHEYYVYTCVCPYPRDLWQSPLCGGEEVSQRGLQLPVQLQRQVHVHRTLLDHLLDRRTDTHTDIHAGVSPQGKDTHNTHTPPNARPLDTHSCLRYLCLRLNER